MSVYIDGDAVLSVGEGAALCRAATELGIETQELGAMVHHMDDLDKDVLQEEVRTIIDADEAETIELEGWVRDAADRLDMFLEGMTWEQIEEAFPDFDPDEDGYPEVATKAMNEDWPDYTDEEYEEMEASRIEEKHVIAAHDLPVSDDVLTFTDDPDTGIYRESADG